LANLPFEVQVDVAPIQVKRSCDVLGALGNVRRSIRLKELEKKISSLDVEMEEAVGEGYGALPGIPHGQIVLDSLPAKYKDGGMNEVDEGTMTLPPPSSDDLTSLPDLTPPESHYLEANNGDVDDDDVETEVVDPQELHAAMFAILYPNAVAEKISE